MATLVVVMAGCTHRTAAGTPSGAPAPGASGSGAAAPTALVVQPDGATFRVTSVLSVAQAVTTGAGRRYQETSRVPGLLGKSPVSKLALTSAGDTVIATAPPDLTTGGEVKIKQNTVSLLGPGGRRDLSLPPVRGAAPRQAIYAAARGDAVAWLETPSTDLYGGDWSVFAATGGTTRLLGTSSGVAPGGHVPAPPGSAAPVLGDEFAYWPTAVPAGRKDQFGLAIAGRRLDGTGPMRIVVRDAGRPAADGKNLYYVRTTMFAPAFAENRYEIRLVDATGADRVAAAGRLRKGEEVSALAADAGTVSWIVTSADEEDEQARMYAWDAAANTAVQVNLADRGLSTEISASGRVLAWGNGSGNGDGGMYLLDLGAEPALFRLGEAQGLSYAFVAGDHLAWSVMGDDPQDPAGNVLVVGRRL
ncbi:hypothetical protein [Actinoplanes palleronii]|nr:hypothetical protein [Actinoplanes palleronii]